MSVRQVEGAEELEQVRELMRAYGRHLADGLPGGPGGAAHVCLPEYEAELAGLPGPYAGPEGVLLLASHEGQAAGCVAMRPLPEIAGACELKRLWVSKRFRGLGLGQQLIQAAIDWARGAGYRAVYLDTLPAAMPEARALYGRAGFLQVERYNKNPVADVVFFRLEL